MRLIIFSKSGLSDCTASWVKIGQSQSKHGQRAPGSAETQDREESEEVVGVVAAKWRVAGVESKSVWKRLLRTSKNFLRHVS